MKIILFTFALLLLFEKAKAYPQLIRHGYTSCNTCHVSPRGGGVLTAYGRALSSEILSTWSYEGEENWHFGALPENSVPDWLHVGGDFRVLQSHVKTEQMTRGRFIKMQEQVELAAKIKNIWISVAGASDTTKESRPWFIPQFYVMASLMDKLNVRMGRFLPRFGLNMPEHILSTRGPLGFGYQKERDTVEVLYQEEKWDASLSATFNKTRDEQEAQGFYAQANYSFGSKDRLGLSLEKKTKDQDVTSVSAHAQWGVTEKLYFLTDSVWQQRKSLAIDEGVFHFAQLGYEIEKGLHVFLIEDFKKETLSRASSSQNQYGLGFTFFPRPHWEIQGVWTRKRELSRGRSEADVAWLMVHFYL